MNKLYLGIIGAVVVVVAATAIYITQRPGQNAATVNGVGIPVSEIDKQIDQVKKQQPNVFQGKEGEKQEEQMRKQALDSLITAELIRQEAEKKNITVPKKEVTQRIQQIKKIFKTDEEFQTALKEQNLTESELEVKVEEQAVAEKMLKQVTGSVKPTNKELKEHYDKNKAQMVEPEKKQWRHIVVKTDKEAKELREQLEDGADFAELAEANSEDTATKDKGGDLGLRQDADFPPEISQGLAGVELNDYSEVIKDATGFHIFQLTEIKQEEQRSFKDVKSQLEQGLTREKEQQKFADWLEKVKKKAKIEIIK